MIEEDKTKQYLIKLTKYDIYIFVHLFLCTKTI